MKDVTSTYFRLLFGCNYPPVKKSMTHPKGVTSSDMAGKRDQLVIEMEKMCESNCFLDITFFSLQIYYLSENVS